MRSFSDFAEAFDLWTDSDEDIATDIKSILDWCPGEIRSRQIEWATPASERAELQWETNRRKRSRID
jgi:hypothetical protein